MNFTLEKADVKTSLRDKGAPDSHLSPARLPARRALDGLVAGVAPLPADEVGHEDDEDQARQGAAHGDGDEHAVLVQLTLLRCGDKAAATSSRAWAAPTCSRGEGPTASAEQGLAEREAGSPQLGWALGARSRGPAGSRVCSRAERPEPRPTLLTGPELVPVHAERLDPHLEHVQGKGLCDLQALLRPALVGVAGGGLQRPQRAVGSAKAGVCKTGSGGGAPGTHGGGRGVGTGAGGSYLWRPAESCSAGLPGGRPGWNSCSLREHTVISHRQTPGSPVTTWPPTALALDQNWGLVPKRPPPQEHKSQ